MNKHRIYVILGAFLILSLVLVSIAAAAPPDLKKISKPRLLDPKDGVTLSILDTCQQVEFKWSEVRNVDHYNFYIESWNENDWVLAYAESVYPPSQNVASIMFVEGYTYRWYVWGVGETGYDMTQSRTMRTFTVDFTYPSSCV